MLMAVAGFPEMSSDQEFPHSKSIIRDEDFYIPDFDLGSYVDAISNLVTALSLQLDWHQMRISSPASQSTHTTSIVGLPQESCCISSASTLQLIRMPDHEPLKSTARMA